jgi:hypothetical protein
LCLIVFVLVSACFITLVGHVCLIVIVLVSACFITLERVRKQALTRTITIRHKWPTRVIKQAPVNKQILWSTKSEVADESSKST